MTRVLEIIESTRIVAIVRLNDLSQGEKVARSLIEGGIRAIEFTLTNRDSLGLVQSLVQTLPEVKDETVAIGIGSVRNPIEAQEAIAAGAQFLVSPVTNPQIIEMANNQNTPVMPGAFSPTEMLTAWELGAPVVKVFPSRQLGVEFIKDCLAPMPFLKLMPTGGVELHNLREFLNAGVFAVGIGSGLVNAQLTKENNWVELTRRAKAFINAATSDQTDI